MDQPVLVALIGAAAAIFAGLAGALALMWTARQRTKVVRNEERLDRIEAWDDLVENNRKEATIARKERDEARKERDVLEIQRDDWRRRALVAERQVEQWIAQKEN